jgi:phosphate transport system substrate-binding protein
VKRRALAVLAVFVVAALAVTAGAGAASKRSSDDSLLGAGSSFAAPLFTAWYQYFNPKAGVNVSYNSIGSGGGIAAITSRTVDFGASDAPLTPDQMAACNGCVQIPVLLGATAVLYNLPGVTKQLHITGKVIADIYLGKISQWDDPALKALNPGVSLPSTKITPAYRSDGSGTSYNFTDYLSKVSQQFAEGVGKSTQPPFKTGVGARGSSGVAGVVTSTQGAIGYADVAYALKNHLRFFAVQNAAGKFETPGIIPTAAAAATIKSVPADNAVSIVDPPKTAKTAYPIGTFTWVIVPLHSSKAKLLKQFILFAISNKGQALGKPLLYTPIPKVIQVAANKTLAKVSS